MCQEFYTFIVHKSTPWTKIYILNKLNLCGKHQTIWDFHKCNIPKKSSTSDSNPTLPVPNPIRESGDEGCLGLLSGNEFKKIGEIGRNLLSYSIIFFTPETLVCLDPNLELRLPRINLNRSIWRNYKQR